MLVQQPVAQFPDFAHAHAIEAVVAPGELLYVPPYTFHQVDTLSDDSADGALGGGVAISMTSWSHNTTLFVSRTTNFLIVFFLVSPCECRRS